MGMSQIKYIVYAWLLAMGLAATYIVVKPLLQSTWVASKTIEELPGCGFVPLYDESKLTQHQGKAIFQANCATCHSLAKTLTGPALAHVEKRGPWKDRRQLVKWVHHPEQYIKKSAYANALFKQYNELPMPSFPHLKTEEIHAIFDYISEVSVLMDKQ